MWGWVPARGLTCDGRGVAGDERVAHVARGARAHGAVVDHGAEREPAAGPRAGVRAALVEARQVAGALGAAHALGPAVRRPADGVGAARARGRVADHAAQREGPTGGRDAGVAGAGRSGG